MREWAGTAKSNATRGNELINISAATTKLALQMLLVKGAKVALEMLLVKGAKVKSRFDCKQESMLRL